MVSGATTILLLEIGDRWIAHLLEHDLLGSGKTRAAAFESVMTAYQWCRENGELAQHGRARKELWGELGDATEVAVEELYDEPRPAASWELVAAAGRTTIREHPAYAA